MNVLLVLLALVVLAAGIYAVLYNGLVLARQKVEEAWSGITVQLKRRYDLIPNLVNTVKGYAKHEEGTLSKVTEARTAAMAVSEGKPADKAKAENILSGTLKSIFALSENYPDLKANENFMQLQSQLSETEDQIAASRRIYNGNVTNLNTKIESFPSNIVAARHHFQKKEFFGLDEGENKKVNEVPKVEL